MFKNVDRMSVPLVKTQLHGSGNVVLYYRPNYAESSNPTH